MISDYKYKLLEKMIKESSGTGSTEQLEALKKEVQTLKTSLTTANNKIKTLEEAKTSLESRIQALESKQ